MVLEIVSRRFWRFLNLFAENSRRGASHGGCSGSKLRRLRILTFRGSAGTHKSADCIKPVCVIRKTNHQTGHCISRRLVIYCYHCYWLYGKTNNSPAAEGYAFFLDSFLTLYHEHADLLRFNQYLNVYVKFRRVTAGQMEGYRGVGGDMRAFFHAIYEKGRRDGTLRADATESEIFNTTLHLMLAAVQKNFRVYCAARRKITIFTVPSGLASGSYTLKVFNEQKNGDKLTDYASAFDEVTLSVKNPITPAVTLAGWTYGETANTPSVSGNTDNGEVTFTYSRPACPARGASPFDAAVVIVESSLLKKECHNPLQSGGLSVIIVSIV